MKQKVTITLSIEPRDYKLKGTAENAVAVAVNLLASATLPINAKIRISSRNHVRYLTKIV